MTKEELTALYKEKILPESKHPYHFVKKEQEKVLAYNPICGDKFEVYLPATDPVGETYFHGVGCAVSTASTSIMIRQIEHMSKKDILALCDRFIDVLEHGGEYQFSSAEMNILAELRNFNGRIDCILLSWKAVKDHFNK